MALIICPGFHPPTLTDHFLAQLKGCFGGAPPLCYVFPANIHPPWSAYALRSFLTAQAIAPEDPLGFIAFSAGCVAAVNVATYLRYKGRPVSVVIAVDGWGVPVPTTVPSYRLSHDAMTHHTSGYLGKGIASFYADPPVEHHALWQQPARVFGTLSGVAPWIEPPPQPVTALWFLQACLLLHREVLGRVIN